PRISQAGSPRMFSSQQIGDELVHLGVAQQVIVVNVERDSSRALHRRLVVGRGQEQRGRRAHVEPALAGQQQVVQVGGERVGELLKEERGQGQPVGDRAHQPVVPVGQGRRDSRQVVR